MYWYEPFVQGLGNFILRGGEVDARDEVLVLDVNEVTRLLDEGHIRLVNGVLRGRDTDTPFRDGPHDLAVARSVTELVLRELNGLVQRLVRPRGRLGDNSRANCSGEATRQGCREVESCLVAAVGAARRRRLRA